MEKNYKEKYRLHSKGDNWWHFRSDPKSVCEAFTVTVIEDGTVVMTGDYGVVSFKRESFGMKVNDHPYWPNDKTDIGYFSEKVGIAESRLKIREWDQELAINEIKEDFEESFEIKVEDYAQVNEYESYDEHVDHMCDAELEPFSEEKFNVIKFVMYESFETEEEMYRKVSEINYDALEASYGTKYTSRFLLQFELFKVWTAQRMNEDGYKE